MKKYAFALLMLIAGNYLSAQDILDIKKGIVTIDGKECMKVDKKDLNNIAITDMSGNDMIYLKYADDKFGQRYNKITFVNSKKYFYSQQYAYANAKMLLSRLMSNHMFDNCTINESKIDNFIEKYGENVTLK